MLGWNLASPFGLGGNAALVRMPRVVEVKPVKLKLGTVLFASCPWCILRDLSLFSWLGNIQRILVHGDNKGLGYTRGIISSGLQNDF